MPSKEYIFISKNGNTIYKCWSRFKANIAAEYFDFKKVEYSIKVVDLI